MDINDYIQNNKSEFDDRDFDENLVWSRIEKELPPSQSRIIPLLKRAAIVAVFITSAIALYQYGYYSGSISTIASENQAELDAIETYYGNKYEVLKSSLKNTIEYDQSTKDAFLKTMEVLEIENIKLKGRLRKDIENEQVMMALVENYKAQINALEDFLGKSQINKNEKENDREYLSL